MEKDIEHTNFFSYAWTSKTKTNSLVIDNSHNNNSYNKILSFMRRGYTQNNEYLYWSIGYISKDEYLDSNNLESKIKEQLIDTFNQRDIKTRYIRILEYNIRFTNEAIKNNKHLLLDNLQGRDDLYIVGGFVSHWNIDSIYEHSQTIVKNIINN